MKVLLVKPSFPYPYSRGEFTYNRIFPPLDLVNCAAVLESAGHKVKILDAHALRIKPEKIKKSAGGFDKIFITSSALDRWQCPNIDISPFLDAVNYLREANNELYITGYHGTAEPEAILQTTKARAVILGEPEYSVLDICSKNDLSSARGICYKDGDKVVMTAKQEPVKMNKLPVPAFHLLDFNRYSYEILGRRLSLFEISRGCRFNCSFCNKVMYGDGLRVKSKEQIMLEVSTAVEKYRVESAYFMDLDFLSDKKTAEELCDYLIEKEYKFQWACQARADLLDEAMLGKMQNSGCRIIHLGVESGTQGLLDGINKGITVEKMKKAVRMCKEAGIKTLAFYLFGLPDETKAHRKKAFSFMRELDTDFISLHRVIPYKGSRIKQTDYQCQEDIDRFIRGAMLRYYLRPSYLFRLSPFVLSRGLKLLWGRINSLLKP